MSVAALQLCVSDKRTGKGGWGFKAKVQLIEDEGGTNSNDDKAVGVQVGSRIG